MKIFLVKNKLEPELTNSVKSDFYKFITQSQKPEADVTKIVDAIIADVRKNGDPTEVVALHQHVQVKVIEVDLERKRIQLSMKGITQ